MRCPHRRLSIASWLVIPALPFGAWIAEHIGRPTLTIVVTFPGIAMLIMAIPFTSSYIMLFAAIGIIFGPEGGLIMALPAQVQRKENRAIGMGIFFTIYYVGMGIFPAIAGYTREVTGRYRPCLRLFRTTAQVQSETIWQIQFVCLERPLRLSKRPIAPQSLDRPKGALKRQSVR